MYFLLRTFHVMEPGISLSPTDLHLHDLSVLINITVLRWIILYTLSSWPGSIAAFRTAGWKVCAFVTFKSTARFPLTLMFMKMPGYFQSGHSCLLSGTSDLISLNSLTFANVVVESHAAARVLLFVIVLRLCFIKLLIHYIFSIWLLWVFRALFIFHFKNMLHFLLLPFTF